MRRGVRFVLLGVAGLLLVPAGASAFGPLASFGELGAGPGQLDAPRQLAVDAGGNVYVADSGNDRVSVFAGDGTFERSFGLGVLDEPQDVALSPGGRAFVADRGDDRVDVFGAAGEFLFGLGEGKLEDPLGIAVSGMSVYVADGDGGRVAAFTTSGTFLSSFSVPLPQDVISGEDGDLYVADGGEEQVDVFTKAGTLVRTLGEAGAGALSGPVSLAADGSGGLYVADQLEERVVHFTESGSFLGSFAAVPEVAGVAAACGGNVFAAEGDASLARVARFGEPGTPAPPCMSTEPEPIVDPLVRPPSNRFRFAGLLKNRRNGFAVLYVRVPGPGKVKLSGRGFRRLARTARQATKVRLPIKPKVRLRHFLKRHGKGRIRIAVTFTPLGGEPRTLEKVVLLRRHRT
jgi:NHL repeat-containing protein